MDIDVTNLTTVIPLTCVSVLAILLPWYHFFPKLLDLTNKHVLLTGGSEGLGLELAHGFLVRGANLTLIARNMKKLTLAREKLLAQRIHESQWINIVSFDLTSPASEVQKMIDKVRQDSGVKVDVLVNNAGSSRPGKFREQDVEEQKKHMDINYFAAVYMTKAVLPQDPDRILFISSMCGFVGCYGYSSYCASKFALRGFAEALNMENHDKNNLKITIALPPDMETPGFELESRTKPAETIAISDGHMAPVKDAAERMIYDTRAGRFFSTYGFDGFACRMCCLGLAPFNSVASALFEVVFGGLFRIVGIYYYLQVFYTLSGFRRKRSQKVNGNVVTKSKEEETTTKPLIPKSSSKK